MLAANLDVLVPQLDGIVVAALGILVNPQLCEEPLVSKRILFTTPNLWTPLTVGLAVLAALNNVGSQEAGNFLGMRNRGRNCGIVGGKVLVLAETTADRLVGGGKGAGIAYNI